MRIRRSRRSTSAEIPGRPSWWTLLAIALAVVAVTFAHIDRPREPRRLSKTDSSIPTKKDLSLAPSAPLKAHDGQPASGVGATSASVTSTIPPPLQRTALEPSPGVQAHSAPTTLPVDTTPTSDRTYTGYLSYPDDIEVLLRLPVLTGSVTVDASWSTEAALQLSVRCDTSIQETTGTESASVTLSGVDSPCAVRLVEVVPTGSPISYSLTVTQT